MISVYTLFMNTSYELNLINELQLWQKKMLQKPSILDKVSERLQHKINSVIPEKLHRALTVAIKHTVQGVLNGADFFSNATTVHSSIEVVDPTVEKKIKMYMQTAAAEGAVTGFWGFWEGLLISLYC